MGITLDVGSGGATLGTDQVAGSPAVDYQIVKIGFSASGTTPTQVSAAAGLPTTPGNVTPVDHADASVAANTTDSTTIAANASRKSVTVFNLSSSPGPLRLRVHGSAAGGAEVLPGASYNIPTQSGLDVVNANASALDYAWQEYV